MRRLLLFCGCALLVAGCASKDKTRCKKILKLTLERATSPEIRALIEKRMSVDRCLVSMKKAKALRPEQYACSGKCVDDAPDAKSMSTCLASCRPKKKVAKGRGLYTRKYRIMTKCMQMCSSKFRGQSEKQRACNIACRKANGLKD